MRFVSLFSGIEAASSAWHPLGWECAAVAEIEPFPSKALAYHYPNVPNLGDVTKITEARIAALGHVDVIVFGSPCQDLSVAGKQKGLAGERSGLFFDALRIVGWLRKHCGLRFALWENVPGAFSSNKGADFAAVVAAMAGLERVDVPPKGWGTEGAALGPEAMVEWSTLDAQWFGVAQRRRRVFALADFGDWAGRPPVLLEPEGLRGDSAPRREAGQNAAGTLASRTGAGGYPGTDEALGGHVIPTAGGEFLRVSEHDVVATLDASFARLQGCSGQDLGHGHSHLVALGGVQRASSTGEVAHCLNAGSMGRIDYETETMVIEPVAFDTTQITNKHNRSDPQPGDPCHPLVASGHPPTLAFYPTNRQPEHGIYADVSSSSGNPPAICVTGEVTHALNTANNGKGSSEDGTGRGVPTVAFSCKDYGADASVEVAPTLRAMGHERSHPNAGGQMAIAFNGGGMQVRRLTPRECERLQAFKDDHTAIPMKRGKPAADGPRYKALGNSMCVKVMHWIGHRIDFVVHWF